MTVETCRPVEYETAIKAPDILGICWVEMTSIKYKIIRNR